MNEHQDHSFRDAISEGKPRIKSFRELIKWIIGFSDHTFPCLMLAVIEDLMECETQSSKDHIQKILKLGENLYKKFDMLLGKNGLLVLPTLPFLAPKHNLALLKFLNVGSTCIFNVLEMPATQIPVGISKDGLPIGVQVVGNR